MNINQWSPVSSFRTTHVHTSPPHWIRLSSPHHRWPFSISHCQKSISDSEGRVRCGVQKPLCKVSMSTPFESYSILWSSFQNKPMSDRKLLTRHAVLCNVLHMHQFSPVFSNWAKAATAYSIRRDKSRRSQQCQAPCLEWFPRVRL